MCQRKSLESDHVSFSAKGYQSVWHSAEKWPPSKIKRNSFCFTYKKSHWYKIFVRIYRLVIKGPRKILDWIFKQFENIRKNIFIVGNLHETKLLSCWEVGFLHMLYLNFAKGFDKNPKYKLVNTKMKWGLPAASGFEDGWNTYSESCQ